MSIHHFTSHLDQVIAYTGDGSYVAKRLVLYPIGASGYAHATLLTMPPGSKVLSHWHDDREAVFYCVRGRGLFVLDDVEREVGPGVAMLQPLLATHGFVAGGEEPFHFLDFALFTERGERRDARECFVHVDDVEARPTRYGEARPFFERFGNDAIRFVGEHRVDGELTADDVPPETEQILLVLDGGGELEFLGRTVPLTPGSVMYLIAGLSFRISGRLRLVGSSSRPGRIAEPPLFDALRAR